MVPVMVIFGCGLTLATCTGMRYLLNPSPPAPGIATLVVTGLVRPLSIDSASLPLLPTVCLASSHIERSVAPATIAAVAVIVAVAAVSVSVQHELAAAVRPMAFFSTVPPTVVHDALLNVRDCSARLVRSVSITVPRSVQRTTVDWL